MSDDDKDLLFYNPTNYVVDVIGEGRADTLGASTMSTAAHWPTPTTPVQPRQLHPDVQQTPVQPRALKDDITKTPVQPRMVNPPLTQNSIQPHATNMPLTQTPVQPRQMPVATSTPLNGIASTNNEGTDDVVNDLGMGTSDSEGTDDVDGLGAYRANPWRQLTAAEATALANSSSCVAALSSPATHQRITNGVPEKIFTCHGYTFMQQRAASGTYWFVYGQPKPIKIPTGRYTKTLYGVPMNGSTTAHWPQAPSRSRGVGTVNNPVNRAEINAANDLLAYLATSGCSKASLPVVVAFQNAYNASGLPGQLTLDGQYGPNTQRALQNTLDEAQNDAGAGPSESAPSNCFPEYGQEPSIPKLDRPVAPPPAPAPPSTTTTTTTTVTGDAAKKSNAGVIIVAATATAVAGTLGYRYWKKHRR
jgi:hypothetical protein